MRDNTTKTPNPRHNEKHAKQINSLDPNPFLRIVQVVSVGGGIHPQCTRYAQTTTIRNVLDNKIEIFHLMSWRWLFKVHG